MIYEIMKVEKLPSKFGGEFTYVFFKGDDGNSYRTCLYPRFENYKNWAGLISVGNKLTGLRLKNGSKKLIDADSKPEIAR